METLAALSERIAQLLRAQHQRLVTAESCTGGYLSKVITDVPGSSLWFERGYIVYSEQSKQDLLSVSPLTLKQFGAVSEETAREMAKGALSKSLATISVAITGIAGPGGATPNKPLGYVWMAWASEKKLKTAVFHFKGDREAVRTQSVRAALLGFESFLIG